MLFYNWVGRRFSKEKVQIERYCDNQVLTEEEAILC